MLFACAIPLLTKVTLVLFACAIPLLQKGQNDLMVLIFFTTDARTHALSDIVTS